MSSHLEFFIERSRSNGRGQVYRFQCRLIRLELYSRFGSEMDQENLDTDCTTKRFLRGGGSSKSSMATPEQKLGQSIQ